MPAGRAPDKSDPTFWNRLYRQNADGTLRRRHREGRPHRHAAEPLRHGRRGGRLRQRRLPGPLRDELRRQHAVPQQRRRHLHRRHRGAPASPPPAGARAPASSTATTTGTSTSSSPATWSGPSRRTATAARRSPATAPTAIPTTTTGSPTSSTTTTATARSRTCRAKAGIANPAGKGLGVSFADFDDDGFTDVYVANDSVQCFLYHNDGDGTFTEVGLLLGVGLQRGREDLRRDGCRLRRLRQRRSARHRRHRSLERALPAVSPGRGRQLPGRHQQLRRGRRDAALLGLEHALLRLRQRRLEGHLRRPGARHGHDREDRAQPPVPAAAAAAAQRRRGAS